MHSRKVLIISASTAVVLTLGCKTEYPDPSQVDIDGIVTTGVGDDGLDGTGTEGVDTLSFCILGEGDGLLQGIKHQCSIEYDLDIQFTVDPPFGSPFTHTQSITAQTGNDSTYEHPMVAVCCSDVTDEPDWSIADSCNFPHHRACG